MIRRGPNPGGSRRRAWTVATALLLAPGASVAAAFDVTCDGDPAEDTFAVELRPVLKDAAVNGIAVESVVYGGLAEGAERLRIGAPIVYAGVDGIADRVSGLRVLDCAGAEVPLTAEDDPPAPGGFPYFRHWQATRAVEFPVTIEYTSAVRPADQRGGPPFDIRAGAGGVSGAGSGFLVLPENVTSSRSVVRWDLTAMGPDAIAATSFGDGDFELAGGPAALRQGWYLAGPAGRYPESGDENGFSASWLGEQPFDAHDAMAWAAGTYSFLGRYFGYLDPPPRYRVFMRTVDAPGRSAGTALVNSFMLSTGAGAAPADDGPRRTFLHEMIHLWVGGVEGPNGVTSWFSEGLTTYYTLRVPLLAGDETVAEHGAAINELARSYYASPARDWSAARIAEVGFGDEEVRHVPYNRGALYFADLDARIRARSGGEQNLDSFVGNVFELRRRGMHFDHDQWRALVAEAAGPEAAATFDAVVLEGQVLEPASDAFGPCFEREPATYDVDGGAPLAGWRWVRRPAVPDAACRGVREPALVGRNFSERKRGVFNGERLRYTATFADTVVEDDSGRPMAAIYATSYVRDDVRQPQQRPVVFLWNGGPSASSQTLHMAGFGPRRLQVPADLTTTPEPPYRTADNARTLLDVADLVFVDPAETGFSRILPGGDRSRLYSVEGDAASVAQFIRRWLIDNQRLESPRYVLGASYGSIRAVAVAAALAGTDTPLDGAVLVSQGVNLVETTQRQSNLVGYASNFSQLAAIAWFHGRSALQDRPVAEVVELAQGFAMGEYLTALAVGSTLDSARRQALADQLEAFTGVSADYYLAHGLVIAKSTFRRLLLEDRGLVLGMQDARFTAPLAAGTPPADQTAGVADVQRRHLTEFLGVDLPLDPYRGLAPDAFGDWDWGGTSTMNGSKAPPGARRTVFADFDYGAALVPAFAANDRFRVLLATGIYDTQTTLGPARLLAADPRYPPSRVLVREYEGGHAFYADDAAYERLVADLRAFLGAD